MECNDYSMCNDLLRTIAISLVYKCSCLNHCVCFGCIMICCVYLDSCEIIIAIKSLCKCIKCGSRISFRIVIIDTIFNVVFYKARVKGSLCTKICNKALLEGYVNRRGLCFFKSCHIGCIVCDIGKHFKSRLAHKIFVF